VLLTTAVLLGPLLLPFLGTAAARPGSPAPQDPAEDPAPVLADAPADAGGPLTVSRGEHSVPIVIPRREMLVFDVSIDLGVLGSPKVGEVAFHSRVDPFPQLLAEEPDAPPLVRGSVMAIAVGHYAFYEVRDELSTQILPQDWPHFINRKVQTGTENRKRELTLGTREGVFTVSYRADAHCHGCDDPAHFVPSALPWGDDYHCDSCRRAEHRHWRPARTKEDLPEGIDMLSATMVARAMIARPEVREERMIVIDKLTPWEVKLSRGETRRHEVEAGTFDTALVRFTTGRPPGYHDDKKDFSGLFGIHGTISMWFEASTGVPVLITGTVPAGPVDLDVRIELKSYTGTPPEFHPR